MACSNKTCCLLQGSQSMTAATSSVNVSLRYGFRCTHVHFCSRIAKPLHRHRPHHHHHPHSLRLLRVQAVSTAPEDCNEEDCAPEKEVGKLSMEWKAEENTKISGTYPPVNKQKSWTGYVEKDTAGQTNIYAIEPTVYVSENAISSNTAGDSESGSQQTLSVAIGLGLSLIVGAELVLQLGNSGNDNIASLPPSSASLSFYIQKFKQEDNSIAQPPAALTNVDIDSVAPATAPETSASETSETPSSVVEPVEPPPSST